MARDGFKHREAANWLLEVLDLDRQYPLPGSDLATSEA